MRCAHFCCFTRWGAPRAQDASWSAHRLHGTIAQAACAHRNAQHAASGSGPDNTSERAEHCDSAKSSSSYGAPPSRSLSHKRDKQRRATRHAQHEQGAGNASLQGSQGNGARQSRAAQKELDRRKLGALIGDACGIEALLQIEQRHGDGFGVVQVAAMFSKAGRLAGLPDLQGHGASGANLLMGRLWHRLRPLLLDCRPRELAIIVLACGKAGHADPQLLGSCLDQLAREAGQAKPRELATALYGAALLCRHGYSADKECVRRLVAALVKKREEADAHILSNVLWAAATMGVQLPEEQVQQLLSAFVENLDQAEPQSIANVLWAMAAMGQHALPEQQVQQLVGGLVRQQPPVQPQGLSMATWAAATMGLQLPEEQVLQLMDALLQQRAAAGPRALSSMLHAVAAMGLRLPGRRAELLAESFSQRLDAAKAAEVSIVLQSMAKLGLDMPDLGLLLVEALSEKPTPATALNLSGALRAAASMGLPVPAGTWRRLLGALLVLAPGAPAGALCGALWAAARCGGAAAADGAVLSALLSLAELLDGPLVETMRPREVSGCLWALAELQLRPEAPARLLAAAAVRGVAQMGPGEVSRAAHALARLGLCDEGALGALVGEGVRRSREFQTPELCSLAWAAAVAGQRRLAGEVVALCREAARPGKWEGASPQQHQQLHHVGLLMGSWRQLGEAGSGDGGSSDGGRTGGISGSGSNGGGGGGFDLSGALTREQLLKCESAWARQLRHQASSRRRSSFQRHVLASSRRLRALTRCRAEAPTPDGACNVDVEALHVRSGRRLAIEADGPSHFLLPCRRPTGDSMARDGLLAARGFVVVVVPWFEWGEAGGDPTAEDAYLSAKVEAALREQGADGPPAPAQAPAAAATGSLQPWLLP